MHTFVATNGTIFHFDGDLAGNYGTGVQEVKVHVPVGMKADGITPDVATVEVPFDDLVELVAEAVRRRQVATAEQAPARVLVGLEG